MLKKIPPYQIIATVGSLLLVAFVLWAYNFAGGDFPDWTFNAAIVVAALVTVMTLLGLWQLYTDYQNGYLFPLRNATLFLTILSVIAIPFFLVWEALVPNTVQPSTLLLLPVFLFMISRNLFYVKVNAVALETKLGFTRSAFVPLFKITKITEDERSIIISRSDGNDIRLLRMFFFAGTWEKLKASLVESRQSSVYTDD